MRNKSVFNVNLNLLLVFIMATIGILIVALGAYRIIAGRSLGVRGHLAALARPIISPMKAVLYHREVASSSQGEFTNIVFLHHSTGRNLINQGEVREEFAAAGYAFWDHDYNPIGLRNPQGSYTGYDYGVPDDNTNPDGLAGIFQQRLFEWPLNTFSSLMQHDVIIIKSCFPISNIHSDLDLEHRKKDYLKMRAVMDRYPDKIFIILTQPPLNPAKTDADNAVRARALANWLTSEEFLNDHPNIYSFDLFTELMESNPASAEVFMLRQDYREGSDSHPNRLANETIGPQFVHFVISAIEQYRAEYPK